MENRCEKCKHKDKRGWEKPCSICRVARNGEESMFEHKTNADRIRSMTDEELAEFLKEYFSCEYGCPAHKTACICDCNGAIIKWLQKDSEV